MEPGSPASGRTKALRNLILTDSSGMDSEEDVEGLEALAFLGPERRDRKTTSGKSKQHEEKQIDHVE